MNVCSITRTLSLAAVAGVAVSSFSGNDVNGLIAAVMVAGLVGAFQLVRPSAASCSVGTRPVSERSPLLGQHPDVLTVPVEPQARRAPTRR